MYYPKSQIKTDLYTNGGEYILSTNGSDYKGYYYETSKGSKFTGKNPEDGFNILILKPYNPDPLNPDNLSIQIINDQPKYNIPYTDFDTQEYFDKFQTNKNKIIRSLPSYNITTPTLNEQNNGVFSRYFCKKNNEFQYIEIAKETYNDLKSKSTKIAWDLYTPLSVLWYIKGDMEKIYNSNKHSVVLLEQINKWYGFSQYIKEDYLKYFVS
jgi:hypothetical protein